MKTHTLSIERATVVEQVEAALREWIVRGELAPGTRLTESRLAEQLGVARNTVREAIRGLIAVHLLEHDPHRGFFVPSLDLEEVDELYRLRTVLEVGALETAARSVESVRGELERSMQRLEEAADANNVVGMFEADRRFHIALASRAGARVAAMLGQILDELVVALAAYDWRTGAKGVVTGQRGLLEALLGTSREDARRVLEAHIEESRIAVIDTV